MKVVEAELIHSMSCDWWDKYFVLFVISGSGSICKRDRVLVQDGKEKFELCDKLVEDVIKNRRIKELFADQETEGLDDLSNPDDYKILTTVNGGCYEVLVELTTLC